MTGQGYGVSSNIIGQEFQEFEAVATKHMFIKITYGLVTENVGLIFPI